MNDYWNVALLDEKHGKGEIDTHIYFIFRNRVLHEE